MFHADQVHSPPSPVIPYKHDFFFTTLRLKDGRITGQRGNRLTSWHHVNFRRLTKMESIGTPAEVTGHCLGCVCTARDH